MIVGATDPGSALLRVRSRPSRSVLFVALPLFALLLPACVSNDAAVNLAMTDYQIQQELSRRFQYGMRPETVRQRLRDARLSAAKGEWQKHIAEFEEYGDPEKGTFAIGVVVRNRLLRWRNMQEEFGNLNFFFDRNSRLDRVRLWRPTRDSLLPAQNDDGRDIVLDIGRYEPNP